MRIEFATEGGIAFFPGLSRPTRIDSADLAPGEARELERLLADANFFDLPEQRRAIPKGAADYQQYTITVEDHGRRHTVRLADPIEDARLQALVDFLRRRAARPATLGGEDEPERPGPKKRATRRRAKDS